MTSRNMLVMPSTTPPDQPRGSRSSFYIAVLAVAVAIGAALIWWPTSDEPGDATGSEVSIGEQLADGQSISNGPYTFGFADGEAYFTRTVDGRVDECWRSSTGVGFSYALVTAQGLVMMRDDADRPIGTFSPQTVGAVAPNDVALRIDADSGSVGVGVNPIARC